MRLKIVGQVKIYGNQLLLKRSDFPIWNCGIFIRQDWAQASSKEADEARAFRYAGKLQFLVIAQKANMSIGASDADIGIYFTIIISFVTSKDLGKVHITQLIIDIRRFPSFV